MREDNWAQRELDYRHAFLRRERGILAFAAGLLLWAADFYELRRCWKRWYEEDKRVRRKP